MSARYLWRDLYAFDKIRNNERKVTCFLFHYRRVSDGGGKKSISRIWSKIVLMIYRNLFGIEIFPGTKIGKGLYIGHPFNITINPEAEIGDNCNIHKGVVIGMENRGERKGAPHIGNNVWIGINAAVVGKITIGDDVLIAPCSYVNCDIPAHSVVFGNPCIIKHRDNATECYITNKV